MCFQQQLMQAASAGSWGSAGGWGVWEGAAEKPAQLWSQVNMPSSTGPACLRFLSQSAVG